jgi:hypothetical protein
LWDKYSATPQIIVLEYDPTATNSHGDKGMFKVIMRDSVPRSDFTLDNAVNKIVEFNGIYRPAYIYVDRGFGDNNSYLNNYMNCSKDTVRRLKQGCLRLLVEKKTGTLKRESEVKARSKTLSSRNA